MNSGIYTITNKTNGDRYVGSSAYLNRRFGSHHLELRKKAHRNRYLQRAWNKYGEDAFLFEILEEWEPEFLISREQWWMNMLCPEYNICLVAGSSLGIKKGPLSEDHKAKLSVALMGHKTSEETRAKIGAANKGRKFSEEVRANMGSVAGWKHTEEARVKISAAGRGRRASEKTRAKMRLAQSGRKCKPFTKEHLTNISIALKGRKFSKEHREKISVAKMGHKVSKETRAKISVTSKGRKHSEKAKAKIGAASKGRKHSEEAKEKMRIVAHARKLTPIQVHEIRHLLAMGDMTQREIAEHYPVSESSIGRIKLGQIFAGW